MTLTNGTKDDFKYTGADNLEIVLEAKRYNSRIVVRATQNFIGKNVWSLARKPVSWRL